MRDGRQSSGAHWSGLAGMPWLSVARLRDSGRPEFGISVGAGTVGSRGVLVGLGRIAMVGLAEEPELFAAPTVERE
jgi:hypothetical protein